MDQAEPAALVLKRRDAWLSEDLDTYLSLTADDYTIEADGIEQNRGRASLEQTVRRNYEKYRPISWEFHEMAVDGTKVLAEWTVTMEARSTGSRWSLKAMSICEVRNGQLAWWREYRLPIT
jgi:limonene-1,2-epoxide hydrolase